MHSLCDGQLYFPIPQVSIYTMLICIHIAHYFVITMLHNAYVGWFWTEKTIFGAYFKVWREWAQDNIPSIERSIIDHIYRWTFIASKDDGPSRDA